MRQLSLVPLGAALLLATVGCVGRSGIDVGESASGLSVCAKGAVTKGVDVSHYDGTIDWSAAHGAGIAFAFMKATENTNFVDPQFAANWKGAGANGVIRGAYHFFRPAADATAQADYFVKTAGIPGPGDLPLTIDLEVTDSVAAATVASGALTFLARVEQLTGKKPIVYTSASFLSSIGSPAGFAAYTLWVANWQVSCPKVAEPAVERLDVLAGLVDGDGGRNSGDDGRLGPVQRDARRAADLRQRNEQRQRRRRHRHRRRRGQRRGRRQWRRRRRRVDG